MRSLRSTNGTADLRLGFYLVQKCRAGNEWCLGSYYKVIVEARKSTFAECLLFTLGYVVRINLYAGRLVLFFVSPCSGPRITHLGQVAQLAP